MFFWLLKRLGASAADSSSKSVAKSRLHLVLVQDRTGLPSEELAQFKSEMIQVIERYFVINQDAFDISYQRVNELTTLQINSPILVKREGVLKKPSSLIVEKSVVAATAIPEALNGQNNTVVMTEVERSIEGSAEIVSPLTENVSQDSFAKENNPVNVT